MIARELESLVSVRYGSAKYLTAFNVGNGTGFECSRRADAIAMSVTPSRDLRLHGFELKVSRADFTREMRSPDKALAFSRYCDHWWMVVAPGVCVVSELPDHWGLLEARGYGDGYRLCVRREAPRLVPEAMSRLFLAGLLRRFSQSARSGGMTS